MGKASQNGTSTRFVVFFLTLFLLIAGSVALQSFQPARSESSNAIYSRGSLHLTIPYHATHAGSGELRMEVLDPDDNVLGSEERRIDPGWYGSVCQVCALPNDPISPRVRAAVSVLSLVAKRPI